jgi:hypothetical protein
VLKARCKSSITGVAGGASCLAHATSPRPRETDPAVQSAGCAGSKRFDVSVVGEETVLPGGIWL